VLLAVCQEFDIETDNDVIPRIAFGFAGGIGNSGAVCGAVVGAVMAIALKQGRADSMEEAMARLDAPQEFRRRFEAEMGEFTCRGLTGADLSTMEARAKYMDSDIAQTVCFPAVGAAFRIVVDLLKETA
jgi:C_GCAxxG_C_C family probable redox protein